MPLTRRAHKITLTIMITLLIILVTHSTTLANSHNDTKKQIDELNGLIEDIQDNIIVTKNGVKIYTSDQITKLDTYNNQIALMQERMRFEQEGRLVNYVDLNYPLISEIEQYGVMSGYTDSLYVDKYFNKKDNDEYIKTLTDYDFFKQVTLEEFIHAVEELDKLGINVENTQIVFNPYRILSGYAYCEDYSPEGLKARRTRIYFNPNDGEDIISTLYHELGHMIYSEQVEDNKNNYNEYYKLYQKDFDKYNAKDSYGRWDYKLTENFAEDFKIYVSKQIRDKHIREFMNTHTKSFFDKDTVYKVSNKTDSYFNKLMQTQEINTNDFRGNIGIKLDDYNKQFTLYDTSYLNQHPNKIVTQSDTLGITLNTTKNGLSILELDTISVYHNEKEKIVKHSNISSINIRDKGVHEIYIKFRNNDYTEEVKFFIVKED